MAGLKLRAEDGEDLKVISAHLQDAIVAIVDLAYLPAEARFALVANRFRWEGGEGAERVNATLRIDGVTAVKTQGIDRRDRDGFLSLLSITAGEGHILLTFSGGKALRLEVARILCHLEDVEAPRPTLYRPTHAIDE